jgi:hypothetical protein
MRYYYALFNRFTISMRKDAVLDCAHPGACDKGVAYWVGRMKRQLSKIDPQDIAKELAEYGAWDENELQDHDANLQRIVWTAANDIREDKKW